MPLILRKQENGLIAKSQSFKVRCYYGMVIFQYWPILFVVAFIGLIIKMTVDSNKLDKVGEVYGDND